MSYQILIPRDKTELRTWGPRDIIIEEGAPMTRTVEDMDIFQRIEETWSAKFRDALEKGKILFAGPQYRLSKYEILADGRMKLALGPTDYREFIGTNAEAGKDSVWLEELYSRGKTRYNDGNAFFSNALAICSVVITADEKIIIGLRSDKVAEYPRCWHTIGGHPDPKPFLPARKIDLFKAMEEEIEEELLVDKEEISSIRLSGLAENVHTLKPELVFFTQLTCSFEDLKNRRVENKADEHFRIFGTYTEDLREFLINNQTNFSFPPGHPTQISLIPTEKPSATSNFFVPSGEAAWDLFLMHQKINVKN